MYEILDLVSRFGPVIVLIGTFFEGEVFAIIGGFLAYRGSYSLEFIVALAFVGSFCGDSAVFLFARFFSNHRWVRRWKTKPKFAKAIRLVDKFHAFFVIVNRYIYGLRMPGLIALGLSSISIVRFMLLNLVGAGLWAGIFTSLGYVFGSAINLVFARLEMMEHAVGITLGVIAAALAIWFAWRQWGPALFTTKAERQKEEANDRAR
ncbi:DedA family protein [Aureimonas leprariae]|uniref:DedA family protein n=1 Tax=Plantimonas leprariae TaxID=2615207 RepID=A0A7V7TX27_9HYPH|nr:DedA family protein [Aureimonas leprariae]KAB0680836.1 DedA family protein [Aureimonas leprariae]